MVADVAVETRRRAKRNKVTAAAAAEEKTPSPPSSPPPAVRRPRQPTPDHPPYCWMIGEAINALGEDGGSSEDAISTFIRGAHRGVPAAHDSFLRHYLAKHVAEGLFVCAAPGRYARCPDDAAAVEAPAEQPAAAARVEAPVVQVKRGRGRPRKDGSSPASPAVKKNGSAGSATPKRRGRPRAAASLAAGAGSVPASSVAAADKNGSQAMASAPRRRRRLRKLVRTSEVSDEALATDKEDDGIDDAPSTMGKVLALVVAGGDVSATTETVDDNDCGRPRKGGSSSTSPAVKKNGSTDPATSKRRGRPRAAASLAAGAGSAPASSVAAADKNGSQAKASAPRRRRRLHKLVTISDVSDDALVTDKEEGGINDGPSTTGKEPELSLALALVVAGDSSATTPTVDDNVCGEVPPSMPVDNDQPRELALVTTTDIPAPTPPPVYKQDGYEEAGSLNRAVVVKQDAISTTSTAPESSSQACELALVAADNGPVPVLVAGNTEGDEVRSAMYKRLRQPRQVSPMIVAALRCPLAPISSPAKTARSKALSVTPSAKGHRKQEKLALVTTAAHSAPMKIKLTPVSGGNEAPSVAPKLYPLTADEIPDDPSWCLLALPAAANAC